MPTPSDHDPTLLSLETMPPKVRRLFDREIRELHAMALEEVAAVRSLIPVETTRLDRDNRFKATVTLAVEIVIDAATGASSVTGTVKCKLPGQRAQRDSLILGPSGFRVPQDDSEQQLPLRPVDEPTPSPGPRLAAAGGAPR